MLHSVSDAEQPASAGKRSGSLPLPAGAWLPGRVLNVLGEVQREKDRGHPPPPPPQITLVQQEERGSPGPGAGRGGYWTEEIYVTVTCPPPLYIELPPPHPQCQEA